ncbi:hypothetical protein T05_1559 [Trichinella murrelli]|uniref:Uncharacterized protein n=1 Tax=Trichinella murrelli TaxID=144512 RepID=A0A0V0TIA0_9BILA|nr:hypothetical protein T05_1559 [Trichinella murrelli]
MFVDCSWLIRVRHATVVPLSVFQYLEKRQKECCIVWVRCGRARPKLCELLSLNEPHNDERVLCQSRRVTASTANQRLPICPALLVGEQVVNSGYKAYGTATAVCHTGKTLKEWRLRG